MENDYRHIGLVEPTKGTSNCRCASIMFVSTEIDVDTNPLVDRITDSLPQRPGLPRASLLLNGKSVCTTNVFQNGMTSWKEKGASETILRSRIRRRA